MSSADRREAIGTSVYWLRTWPRRYGFALIAVAVASALRYLLGRVLGPNAPFLLFYPAILLVAWLAGLGPGVFAVIVSAISAIFLFFGQAGPVAFGLPPNTNGLMLFATAGLTMSGLAHVYRLRAQRLREFEKAAAGVEEGIIILDRHYRYIVANRVFLAYRGMSREQLIGRSLPEMMGPDVFAATVKPKLDECFQGKVVQFEKRYGYPSMGERDFSVSYFPIEGPTGIDRVACILQDVTEQKDAERELKLFRTLMDQSSDAVEVVDPETHRFLDVNEKACKDLGYTRSELLSMTVFEIDSNAETIWPQVLDAFRNPGFAVRQSVRRRKDGSTFPVELSLKFVALDRNYIVAVCRDITERQRTEEALREREEKFHQVADNIQEIFWMVDAVTQQAIYVNPAFEHITGRTVASLLDSPLSYREIIHPDDRGRVLSRLEEAARTGSLKEEFRIVRPDGTIRWVGAQGFPVPDTQGKLYRLAGVVQDITERRRAEEALLQSEDRYRDLIEHSEDLVCTHDLAGNLLSVNPAPARLLGYDVAELLQMPMRDLLAPETRERFDAYLERIKVTGADHGLLIVLTRNGERRVWEYHNTLRTEGVPTPVVRGMAHDVTERTRAEEGRKAAERSLVENEERFRIALKDSPITVFNQDRELRYTWIYNPHLYWQNDIIGKTDDEIMGADPARALVALKSRVLKTGARVREEVLIRHDSTKLLSGPYDRTSARWRRKHHWPHRRFRRYCPAAGTGG